MNTYRSTDTLRPLTPRWRRALALAAAAPLLVAGAVSCADDDASDAQAANTEAADAPEPDQPAVLEITMEDFHFGSLPEEIAAGTRLDVSNASESELHEVVAIRLPDDEERSLVEMGPELIDVLHGTPPSAVILVPPGGEMIVPIGDGTLSEPGRYALVCLIPTGADPELYLELARTSDGPPEFPGGPPHIEHGMFAEIVVTA